MKIEDYNIIICNSKSNIKDMINYFNIFLKIKNNKYIGIDFEFNRVNNERKIALFQLNLESKNVKTIFMFYPPDLDSNQLKILKKLLFNEKIIIHGGESLDIPYLFSEIFKNKKEMVKFCKNLYDTKFLCDYYNNVNDLQNNKCKIYYLLQQMNVIDNDKFEYLIKNEEKMGEIYNIFIDVNNMKKELVLYSLYDVLYLPRLFNKFKSDNSYNKYVPEITNIVLLSKQIGYLNDKLNYLNTFNNNYIIKNGKVILFNTILNKNLINIMKYKNFNHIYSINYLKKFLNTIIKLSIYIYLTNNFEYYIKRNEIGNVKINDFKSNLKQFDQIKNGYEYLIKLNENIVKEILI